MTIFQEKERNKFLQKKFPKEISTMFYIDYKIYTNKNICVTSVTSTDPRNSHGRWKAFMTNTFLQDFVVHFKGKDKGKPAIKKNLFSPHFQSKDAFSQGSISGAEPVWVMDEGFTVGVKAHTMREMLSTQPRLEQIPPLVAAIWKLPDNWDIKGDLLLILTSDEQEEKNMWHVQNWHDAFIFRANRNEWTLKCM